MYSINRNRAHCIVKCKYEKRVKTFQWVGGGARDGDGRACPHPSHRPI